MQAFLDEGLELLRDAVCVPSPGDTVSKVDACLFILQENEDAPLAACAGNLPDGYTPMMPSRKKAAPEGAWTRKLHSGEALLVFVLPAAGAPDTGLAHKTLDFCAKRLDELAEERGIRLSIGEEALEMYREISVLQRAVENLNSSMKYGEVIHALAAECRAATLPAEYCLVFGKEGRLELVEMLADEPGAQQGPVVPLHELANIARSELFADVLRRNKPELVNNLDGEPRWCHEVPGLARLLLVPLKGGRFEMGVLALAGVDRSQTFTSGHLKKAATLAGVGSISLANSHHFEQVQFILMALIKAMATAIDARDRLTAGHSQRVAQYALGLAMRTSEDHVLCPEVSFSDEQLQELFYAGLLHDVGKIGVREEVLTKETRLPRPHLELVGLRLALWGEMGSRPWKELYARLEIINKAYDITDEDSELVQMLCTESLQVGGSTTSILSEEEGRRLLTPRGNLTPLEWEEIKRHPEESHRILQNIPFTTHFPNILTIVLQHHERLDGSGYPYGASGRKLIIQSRIMAIVDVYDALRQDRHYKKALSRDMALTILRQEARRKKLDARLVELFCRDIEKIEKGLNTGMDFLPGRDFLQ